jgi:hypothetical protein
MAVNAGIQESPEEVHHKQHQTKIALVASKLQEEPPMADNLVG